MGYREKKLMQMSMILLAQFINMNRLAIHDPYPSPVDTIHKVKVIFFLKRNLY